MFLISRFEGYTQQVAYNVNQAVKLYRMFLISRFEGYTQHADKFDKIKHRCIGCS